MNQEITRRNEPRLTLRQMARVEGWGMVFHSHSYYYQPCDLDELNGIFKLARSSGKSVALRGSGNSYGDASINENEIVLDLGCMDRILDWNPVTGVITVEPGVTLERIWKHIIRDGWWPTVVSGTMKTTAGGCASMNIHGKNNYQEGPFGNHVIEFDLMLPDGTIMTCSRESNAGLFHAAIGGFGMLGCFTRLVLRMKKVYSGLLRVEAVRVADLDEMVDVFEPRTDLSDYLVGWTDCIKGGPHAGRGIMHSARYLQPGEDKNASNSLTVAAQELPGRILGVVPRSLTWMMMSPLINNPGMRLVNTAKFWFSRLSPPGHSYLMSHAEFAFLLDYVPNWKWAYRPGGLIQYQSFLPGKNAIQGFEEIIQISRKSGMPAYLGVFKKHRPDSFLMTHALDGYSLALDFRVTSKNRDKLWAMTGELDRVVLDAGGKFYFAKDSTLKPDVIDKIFPAENLKTFLQLKNECDPENLLQTNLSRRLFGNRFSPVP
jgi:decaprenylphospho-beta-D-ribofuranose 2-oxidase